LHILDGVAVDTDGQPRTVSLTDLAPHVGEWWAALRWAAAGGSARAGLRLARALDPWWREQGGARDGRDLLYRLYGRFGGRTDRAGRLASAYLVTPGWPAIATSGAGSWTGPSPSPGWPTTRRC